MVTIIMGWCEETDGRGGDTDYAWWARVKLEVMFLKLHFDSDFYTF